MVDGRETIQLADASPAKRLRSSSRFSGGPTGCNIEQFRDRSALRMRPAGRTGLLAGPAAEKVRKVQTGSPIGANFHLVPLMLLIEKETSPSSSSWAM